MPRRPKIEAGTPDTLEPGGRDYWDKITEGYALDETQLLLLLEACRCKDRLDRLDAILRGDTDTWAVISPPGRGEIHLEIDKAASVATSIQNMMKQLVATLRLADTKAGRPYRAVGNPGSARGAYNKGTTGKPQAASSLDRARERAKSA